MIWQSLKPALLIVLAAGVVLLALGGLVSLGVDKIIVPPPEMPAEQLTGALGAHRYNGAMNELSQELKQQVKAEDLVQLVQRIEQSPAQGIQDAHGQSEQTRTHGDQGTAAVEVTLGNNQKVNIELPIQKENGVWKVSSIEPLRGLAK